MSAPRDPGSLKAKSPNAFGKAIQGRNWANLTPDSPKEPITLGSMPPSRPAVKTFAETMRERRKKDEEEEQLRRDAIEPDAMNLARAENNARNLGMTREEYLRETREMRERQNPARAPVGRAPVARPAARPASPRRYRSPSRNRRYRSYSRSPPTRRRNRSYSRSPPSRRRNRSYSRSPSRRRNRNNRGRYRSPSRSPPRYRRGNRSPPTRRNRNESGRYRSRSRSPERRAPPRDRSPGPRGPRGPPEPPGPRGQPQDDVPEWRRDARPRNERGRFR